MAQSAARWRPIVLLNDRQTVGGYPKPRSSAATAPSLLRRGWDRRYVLSAAARQKQIDSWLERHRGDPTPVSEPDRLTAPEKIESLLVTHNHRGIHSAHKNGARLPAARRANSACAGRVYV